jgi:IclR family transcriptional regulator, pca regulon regulatory protein
MGRPDTSPDFIEAIARGLDVIRAFPPQQHEVVSLASLTSATGLAKPTVRRILLTLEELGYVRTSGRTFDLTPRVLDLGMSYLRSHNLWEVARPHMEALVTATRELVTIAQLDGSDIVSVARVGVPKIVTLGATIGSRFPAMQTALGKVLLAALPPEQVERVLSEPSRSPVIPTWQPDQAEREAELREVRARGWALSDEQLAPGIRAIAAPLRDAEGRVIAAMNLNAYAAETPVAKLTGEYLPMLLRAVGAVSVDLIMQRGAPPTQPGTSRDHR